MSSTLEKLDKDIDHILTNCKDELSNVQIEATREAGRQFGKLREKMRDNFRFGNIDFGDLANDVKLLLQGLTFAFPNLFQRLMPGY